MGVSGEMLLTGGTKNDSKSSALTFLTFPSFTKLFFEVFFFFNKIEIKNSKNSENRIFNETKFLQFSLVVK